MRSFLILLILMGSALAQDAKLSPVEKALSDKLLEEIQSNIQFRVQVGQLQMENAALKKMLDTVKPPVPKD